LPNLLQLYSHFYTAAIYLHYNVHCGPLWGTARNTGQSRHAAAGPLMGQSMQGTTCFRRSGAALCGTAGLDETLPCLVPATSYVIWRRLLQTRYMTNRYQLRPGGPEGKVENSGKSGNRNHETKSKAGGGGFKKALRPQPLYPVGTDKQ